MEEVNQMDDGQSVGGVFLAFLAGTAVGAALGLILAPSSGAETRRRVKAASVDAKDKAMEKVESVRSDAVEMIDRGREKVADVKSQIETAVDAGKEAYTRKKDELTPKPADEKE